MCVCLHEVRLLYSTREKVSFFSKVVNCLAVFCVLLKDDRYFLVTYGIVCCLVSMLRHTATALTYETWYPLMKMLKGV